MRRPASIHFIIAALFALCMLGGYIVVFMAFSKAKEGARNAALEVARIEEEDAAILNAQETIEALAEDEAMLRSYFVTESGIVAFLEELERSGDALSSDVEVVSVQPSDIPNGRLILALKIEGSFSSVMRTLGSLEHGPQDMRIHTLTLDTLPSEGARVWTAAATFSVATIEETP